MARQYPHELHIGQKVIVHLNPTMHPIEALVSEIDKKSGVVHVNPIGYKVRWITRPRAISISSGHHLEYKDHEFFFVEKRSFN